MFLYLLLLGLFRLRTFCLEHGLVRCKLECRCWRARGEDVSFTDVKIKIPDRKCDQGACAEDFGRFLRKVRSWVLQSEEEGRLSFAHRGLVAGAHVMMGGGGRWKSQHRKIVPLSLGRKTFKLKGNKKFRTWTKKS